MTSPRLLAVVTLSSCAVMVAARPQLSTFRMSSDLVPVYVSVRAGGELVGRLEAKDFALSDNKVPQDIDEVMSERVPIDVTLMVDTSSSVIRSLEVFRADVIRIAHLLRPEEQMRLVTFDTRVREILPMRAPADPLPVEAIRLGDETSLNDALLFSLARAPRQGRRHLVFVFTDGFDTASVLDAGALSEIASRADALLHIALVRPNAPPDERDKANLLLLADAAARTGGALYPPTDRDADLVPAFERAIESFRASYVLYYAPTGVTRAGWHNLDVSVVKSGNFQVSARRGYFGR